MSTLALWSIVGISVFFGVVMTTGILIFRHDPAVRRFVILGAAALESLVLTVWVVLFLTGRLG